MSSDNATMYLAPVASNPNYTAAGPGLDSFDHDYEYGDGDQGDQPVYADVADAEYAVPTAEEAVYLAPVVAAGTDATYEAAAAGSAYADASGVFRTLRRFRPSLSCDDVPFPRCK